MDFSQLGKEPISDNAPAGTDVRYEPEYEALQAEIDKLSSPTASSGVDWNNVANLSAKILAEKSKDLLVASYFAVSRLRADKVEGLATGLTVMHDMVANYWDQLYPVKKRMRGRLGAFEWWLEKTMKIVENQEYPPVAAEAMEAMLANLDGLDELLSEHMPEPPMLIKLKRYIERLPSKAAAPDTEPEADAAANPEESPSAPAESETPVAPEPSPLPRPTASPESPEPAVNEEDANVLISGGLKYLKKAVDLLNNGDWSNAKSYRIRRQTAWMNLDALPADTNGKTMIPPPSISTVQAFSDTREQGAWVELLMAAEPMISQDIFWLDLNRFVAEALADLGSGYQEAHDAVCMETAFFLHRFPGVTKLTFATGTPFADADTIAWLKGISVGSGMAMEAPVSVAGDDGSPEEQGRIADTLYKAQELAGKKKIVDAVTLLQEEMQNAHSHKESLLWRMALCQVLIGAKKAPLVLPHLEMIVENVGEFQLETWEPELALRALKIAWQGYKAQKNQDDKEKAAVVLNRINRLNPVEALGMK